jgi:peptide/nickel transport system permease protein
MLKYTLRKLLAIIPKLLAISLLVYCAMDLLPGDPLTRAISPDLYAQMTEEQRDLFRESMGLNGPLPARYAKWLWGLLQGDFGYSQSTGANIGTMVATRLPYTIELAFWGLVFATVFGLLFGYLAAIYKNTVVDWGCTAFSILGISVPSFFFGIIFILFFALNLKILPTGGRMPVGEHGFFARVPYLIMPAMTMGITLTATLTRFTRGSMLDVLNKDYIKTARSKGLRESTVYMKHGFRNALIPVTTLVCMRLPMLVGGSVVIETVFNYPAVGKMAMDALNAGDIPVVMISTMVSAMVTLVASSLVDLATALLDPRVRLE